MWHETQLTYHLNQTWWGCPPQQQKHQQQSASCRFRCILHVHWAWHQASFGVLTLVFLHFHRLRWQVWCKRYCCRALGRRVQIAVPLNLNTTLPGCNGFDEARNQPACGWHINLKNGYNIISCPANVIRNRKRRTCTDPSVKQFIIEWQKNR